MVRRFSGRRLRDLRVAAALQREQVALDIGRSCYTIISYESGRVVPPSDVVGMLADLFGVPVDDLYHDAEMAGTAA